MTNQRIIATVNRDEFVGRDDELRQIRRQASRLADRRGLLLLAEPGAGASELLRQAYDELFSGRGDFIPLHFAFRQGETPREAARRFFQNFLQQYIAYRRVDPELCTLPRTLRDLSELSLPGDFEPVNELIENYGRAQSDEDQQDFVRFCLSAPYRLSGRRLDVFTLIDCVPLSWLSADEEIWGREIGGLLSRSGGWFALAGLRRRLTALIQDGGRDIGELAHLERLNDTDAQRLIGMIASRYAIETNEPTRDLLVQQLNGSPLFINYVLQAARETKAPLINFLNCQRLYLDEVIGGRLHRCFSKIIDQAAPHPETRKTLLRVLYESVSSDGRRPSLWAWKKRLKVESADFERIVDLLHVHELINSSRAFIEVNADSQVWMDYLRMRYRLEVAAEPRALVVASELQNVLKRAPQTMARKYRREAALGLRDLLSRFDCQRVPASLFHYDRFAAVHKGAEPDSIDAALDAESEIVRLPQIVHTTGCSAFAPSIPCEAEACAVGHGFEAADYSDENETVWLTAQIDSKLEAGRDLAEEWHSRLLQLARECGFQHARLWLIAPEGFAPEACTFLNRRGAYFSSRQQVELLTARLQLKTEEKETSRPDEYEIVIPMGHDSELVAAQTVQEIARRLNFAPEAINQIKTALVEACINAAEHSLSPDRKIYQRIRVEGDKLVLIVASRGVVPASSSQNGEEKPGTNSRRGWGLKLIRKLMDEVDFERVDDGTQLRMTKYVR